MLKMRCYMAITAISKGKPFINELSCCLVSNVNIEREITASVQTRGNNVPRKGSRDIALR